MDPIARRVGELAGRVEAAKTQDIYTYLQPVEAVEGARAVIEGRSMLLGASYSYLGLLGHPAIARAAHAALDHYGSGTHGVRLLAGNTDLHDRLEAKVAAFMRTEAAVVYSSGYVANLTAIAALLGRGDVVICDKLNHASIVDGCLLSGARFVRVPHKSVEAVDRALAEITPGTGKLVVVDAVFSMDGDVYDLPGLVEVCRRHGAWLMTDESHSLGVLGRTGRGVEEHFGVTEGVHIKMSSLSKSIPSAGGFIAGSRELVTYLKHASRAFIFSAAVPPASAAASIAALDLIDQEPDRVPRVQRHVRRFRDRLRAAGIAVRDDPTPIVPIITVEDEPALVMARRLFERGVFVPPIISPAVPPRTARLRTTVTAGHSDEDVEFLADALIASWNEVMAVPAGTMGPSAPAEAL